MKIEKLDSKQVPQVIGLGIVSAGVLIWAGVTFFGGTNPTPVTNPKPEARLAKAREAETATTPGATAPGLPGAAGLGGVPGFPGASGAAGAPGGLGNAPGIPGLQLPGQYNPDPFKSGEKPVKKEVPKPAPTAQVKVARASVRPGPPLPGVDEFPGMRNFSRLPPPRVNPEPVKTGPTRPELSVTGIINSEDGKDMALIEMGADHRIVQEGDMLPFNYRVKKIATDGVTLVCDTKPAADKKMAGDKKTRVPDSDRFFVALGMKGKAAGAPTQTAGPNKG